MDANNDGNARHDIIAISRQQFTVSDGLALYFLLKRFPQARCMDENDISDELRSDVIAEIKNSELRIVKETAVGEPLEVSERHLKQQFLGGTSMKLTAAGSAFALCCATLLEANVRARFDQRTENQVRHDVGHVYEAVVEVVDTVHWRGLLPYVKHELKYPNAQKIDLLARVSEIADWLRRELAQRENNFLLTVEEAIDFMGLEYENVVDWFLDEGLRAENNFWVALNHRSSLHNSKLILCLLDMTVRNSSWTYSILEQYIAKMREFNATALSAPIIGAVVRATGRRFLFPIEWSKDGTTLSQQLGVPGLLSITHSRDYAVAENLLAAYELAVRTLRHVVADDSFEPTREQRDRVGRFWEKILGFVSDDDRTDIIQKLARIQVQHKEYMDRDRPPTHR